MEKIASFKKNHNVLKQGFHFCNVLCGVTTFDLRFKKPNGGDYLNFAALHTIEHLLATIFRNSEYKDDIIYFGPMGCRTGFYLLTVNLDENKAKKLTESSIEKALELDEIPGAKKEECGNYKEHNLELAKKELSSFLTILKNND